ncbi:MAG: carboxylating nicotinate-nucleotide diphosphorylase [Planctomycetota bacterium]
MADLLRSARDAVSAALAEDLGCEEPSADRDLTSRLVISADLRARARIEAKRRGTISGIDCAEAAFRALDPDCSIERAVSDGDRVEPGSVVLVVSGRARAILAAERTALNFLQRLSGIATATRAMVDAVEGTGAAILDTRKTTPGLRALEKRAVLAGGGRNHRIGLFDQVLLKENHFAAAAPASYEEVVRRCVEEQDAPVVAEARSAAEAASAVRGGASVVLLDNFDPDKGLREAVAAVKAAAGALGREVLTEASGGIRLDNVRKFAECGVDRISVGALTHSAPALDLSLLVEGTP